MTPCSSATLWTRSMLSITFAVEISPSKLQPNAAMIEPRLDPARFWRLSIAGAVGFFALWTVAALSGITSPDASTMAGTVVTSQVIGQQADLSLLDPERKVLAKVSGELPVGGVLVDEQVIVVSSEGTISRFADGDTEADRLGMELLATQADALAVALEKDLIGVDDFARG